jgi:septal ring factor EnvC (AmiA/AmiB activator)
MKWYSLAFCLAVFSVTICAQQADPCTALVGSALDRCQVSQQKLQQQQLTQQQQQLMQLQQQLAQQQQQLAQQQEQLKQQQEQLAQQQQQLQQQEGQNQLSERQLQNQPQLEGMQHQIAILSQQLEHDKSANQPVQSPTTRPEVKSWKADNPWFGSDYARTQFAMRYAKQLQQERPDLVGRPFLDAISVKVRDKFGASK